MSTKNFIKSSFTLPENVDKETIAEYVIPEEFTEIEDYAFKGCERLENVKLPDNLKKIGEKAFYGCKSLKCIRIPDSVKKIGKGAFAKCKNIRQFEIGKNNSKYFIEDGVLYERVKSLSDENLKIHTVLNLEGLEHWEFKTKINKNVREILPYAFAGSSVEKIDIPDFITSIGEYAFYCCEKLKKITLPLGIKSIKESTFEECSKLDNVVIPEGVKTICGYAFRDCEKLKHISIPSSVWWIGCGAFTYCSGLEEIVLPRALAENEDDETSFTIFVCCENLKVIKFAD